MMYDLTQDIRPLTDFKRKTAAFTKQLKKTGQPLVLTVNGKAELVVHDVTSYQKLREMIERAEAVAGIRKGLESFKRGKGIPLGRTDQRIRRKYGIPR
jgi:PHD/YefM family antitoxin component YafN of YafNO toxin-antitoxin module